ncbi:MAG: glycosyltransferase family 4 protein [Syntrophobacteraceae bacterium]
MSLRVLLSAYACEPGKGSEPGVGWNWARQIARFHEVWVITRANNRRPIEAALAHEPLPTAHFVYVDLPSWVSFWKKGRCSIYLYYYLWQVAAYIAARKLHRQLKFDVVHHVTFVKHSLPSFVALLPVPFVWGPVGGGESAPRGFWRSFSLRGNLYEILRGLARRLGELDPFVRLTAKRSVLALATTEETAVRLRALGCRNTKIFSQIALPNEEIERLACLGVCRNGRVFRALSLGDLLHWKGFELGLRGFALFHSELPESEYWLIGDGPGRKRLEKLARDLHVQDSVVFWGELSRADALAKLGECDVLVHPSLHDSGGWVCVEAMAAGRPVVCLDLGGPALQVIDTSGMKLRAESADQVVQDLAGALKRLESDPTLPLRLGIAGRERVREHFSWEKKGTLMRRFYQDVRRHRPVVALERATDETCRGGPK